MARLHQLEAEDGALEELARYPVDRHAIYLGKLLAGFAVMLVLGGVLLPVVAILYGSLGRRGCRCSSRCVLGAIGFAAVGTAYAGAHRAHGAREVMLPLLMLPVVAPLLLAAVKATAAALGGDPLGELGAWLQLLVAFDIIMIVAGAGTYGFLLED